MNKIATFKMLLLFPLMHLLVLWGMMTSEYWFIILIGGILLYFPMHQLGASMGYHKLFSHKSFEPQTWFPPVSAFIGIVSFNGDPLTYSLIHRIHHKYADTDLDPHNPARGLFNCYLGWVINYKPKDRDIMIIGDLVKKWPWLPILRKFELVIIATFYILLYTISPLVFYTVLLGGLLSTHYGLAVNTFGHDPKQPGTNKAVNNELLSKLINPIFMHHTHHETANCWDYSEGSVVDYSKYFKRFIHKKLEK
jgi:stearoyl-CoA desaturase (delta-9 desaturase)